MLPWAQPPAEVRVDPVREMLEVVARGLAAEQVQGLRRPLEEARKAASRQPEGLQAMRAEGLHGLLLAAEGRRMEGDEAWARVVRHLHGLLRDPRHPRPAQRLPVLELLHELLVLADLEDIPVQEALLEARLDRNPAFDARLEEACLKLIAHHYRGWLDPRPPDVPRLVPLAKALARLWLRLPAPPRTGRVVSQALRGGGAEGVWKLVAQKGDGELRTLAADLLKQLDPAFLDAQDEALWRTLAALGSQEWAEPVRVVTQGMEARLRARLKAAPRDGVLAGQVARWYLAVGAPGQAVAVLREALSDSRLPDALRPGLLEAFGAAAQSLGDPELLREARGLGCALPAPSEPRAARPDPVVALEEALRERPGDPLRLMARVEACVGEDPEVARRGVEAALALWERSSSTSWPLARVEALVWMGCMLVGEGRSREGLRRIQDALDGLPEMGEEERREARKVLGDSAFALELVPDPSRLGEVLPLLDRLDGRLGAGASTSGLFVPPDDARRLRWQRRSDRAGRVAFVWE